MTALRAFLVDDEPLALERLARLLEATGRVTIVGRATEPEKAVAGLAASCPDVCFLDIHMPRLTGFDVLARLARQPLVVFTTAHDEHALEAFSVNAVDYLLKPVDAESLARALAKAERFLAPGGPPSPDLRALLEEVAASLRRVRAAPLTRVASRLGDRICFVDVARVTHFYSEDRLTYAAADGRAYAVDQTIAALETRLDPAQFFRIHRATLVHLAWIKEVTPLPSGGLNVRLNDARGTDLTVARDRAHAFKARLVGSGPD